MPGKILVILFSLIFIKIKSVPLSFILVPSLLFPIAIGKVFFSNEFIHLLWGLKPYFLIPGYLIGERLRATLFKFYPTLLWRDLFIIFSLLCIGLIQFQGIDVWSGSGAFGIRSTMGFRGFGELSIVVFMIGMTQYFPIVLVFFLLSASKLVLVSGLLGLFAALMYKKPYARLYFILLIINFLFLITWFDDAELIAKTISTALYYSVIDCGLDCSSFSNRFEAIREQWNAVTSSAYVITGSLEQDVFVVQPEIALLYYYKLYGIVGLVPFFFILSITKYTRWGWLFLLTLVLDVYSFSMIGYFMIGIILSNADKITDGMQHLGVRSKYALN